MLIDAKTADGLSFVEVDVCVVGAGAAGISVAMEFVNSPLEVCLVEAGGLDYEAETQALQKGDNIGLPYYDLEFSHLRYFGGTTNHWSGWSRPYDEIDFRSREFIEGSGWPISKEELDSYYLRALAVCDLGDKNFDLAKNSDQLNGFYQKQHPGHDLVTRLWHRSGPTRFGTKYRQELSSATNIKVILNANVVAIESNQDKSSVTEVRAATLNGRNVKVKAKYFVLCMGGIETPRLLLASDIGNQNDQVGRYFMLHPSLQVGKVMGTKAQMQSLNSADFIKGRASIRAGLSLNEETQIKEKLPNHAVLFSPRKQSGLEKLASQISSQPDQVAIEQLFRGLNPNAIKPKLSFDLMDIDLRMEHLPNPESRLLLSDKTDELGVPLSVLDWRITEQDFDGIKRTVELISYAISALGTGRVQTEDWLYSDEKSLPENGGWDYHHMGATRMSSNSKTGVVDKHCKVHGVENLFVASSSVFSTSGFSNPTLTIVALGLRIADRLKRNF